jgi:ATP-binding cassette subfamily B protein
MSGGQRQRLAIARALLRDPAVLILDEATSALDAQTEREILDTLASVVKGRTTVTITHRLALAAAADLIYVLDQGILVEQGTHDQLISLRGLYSRLYEEQTGRSTTGRSRVGVEAARLRTIPLFARLNSEALASLAERLMTERYAPGEDVVVQGDAGDKLYIVGRGQVDIIVGHPPGQQIVNTLNDGDYFGEMALMFGEPRTATVRTTMPTELYSLSHWDFSALLQRDPAVRAAISETIANRRAALSAATSTSHQAVTSAVPVN